MIMNDLYFKNIFFDLIFMKSRLNNKNRQILFNKLDFYILN